MRRSAASATHEGGVTEMSVSKGDLERNGFTVEVAVQ